HRVQRRRTQLGRSTRGFYRLRQTEWFCFRHEVIVKEKTKQQTPGTSSFQTACRAVFASAQLPCCDIRDPHVRVRVVPLRGDAFKGQAEGSALAGRQRRQVQVNGFVVRPVSPQDT